MQDQDNSKFLPGGTYQDWSAASDNPSTAGKRAAIVIDKDLEENETWLFGIWIGY